MIGRQINEPHHDHPGIVAVNFGRVEPLTDTQRDAARKLVESRLDGRAREQVLTALGLVRAS